MGVFLYSLTIYRVNNRKGNEMKKRVVLTSHYGNLRDVTMLMDDNRYVSYRQACKAAANSSGDYYDGLVIDRAGQQAWISNDKE